MALFDIPTRSTKDLDAEIINKSKEIKTSNVSIKASSSAAGQLQSTIKLVNEKLGHYKNLYTIINSEDELRRYLNTAVKNKYIAIDTETTGLNVFNLQLAGICIYTPSEKPAYIPVNHRSNVTLARLNNQLNEHELHNIFKDYIDLKWIMHNADYDIRVLMHTIGIRLSCYWDTQIAACCIDEIESHRLKDLHLKYCPDEFEEESITFGDLFKGNIYLDVPVETACLYAAGDAIKTFDVYEYQLEVLSRPDMRKVYNVFVELEMPIVDVVIDMEERGVEIDYDFSKELSTKYHNLQDLQLEKVYNDLSIYKNDIENYRKSVEYEIKYKNGKKEIKQSLDNVDISKCTYKIIYNAKKLSDPVNISSTSQLSIILYDILHAPVVKYKRDGSPDYGTGEEILGRLIEHDFCVDLCKDILELRSLNVLISTFIDKLPNSTESDNRIHCSFNQYGARTGRFSSNNPNLQNIPSKNAEIRKMFKATDGYVLIGADYSQQEPKVMTHMCQDQKMIESYLSGKDLYSEIAALAFNRTYEQCLEHFPKDTPIKKIDDSHWVYSTLDDYDKLADGETDEFKEGKSYRSQAKSILLGVLYGRGVASVAEQLNTTKDEAQKIKDKVFVGFPAIPKFEQDSINMAKQFGYVETAWGRRRHLPEMQYPKYIFTYANENMLEFDPLEFSKHDLSVPKQKYDELCNKFNNVYNKSDREKLIKELKASGINVVDNSGKIIEATRQCVNSRIQGSAADCTKAAMIAIRNDDIMKDLDFHLILQIHDEVIGECPECNIKAAKERLEYLMGSAVKDKICIPMKCDATVTKCWYGEQVRF